MGDKFASIVANFVIWLIAAFLFSTSKLASHRCHHVTMLVSALADGVEALQQDQHIEYL